MRSTPSFDYFDPSVIPMQDKLFDDILCNFDYSMGTHEVLLSGSVGSTKSLVAAHLGLRHVLTYPRSRLLLARRSLPDLKQTIFQKIIEHIDGSGIEKYITSIAYERGYISFANGSEIISRSWADKRYMKFRSLELSACIIEELTENIGDDAKAYHEIKMRIGRLNHVPEKWIISCTNPDEPGHWVYKYFELP